MPNRRHAPAGSFSMASYKNDWTSNCHENYLQSKQFFTAHPKLLGFASIFPHFSARLVDDHHARQQSCMTVTMDMKNGILAHRYTVLKPYRLPLDSILVDR